MRLPGSKAETPAPSADFSKSENNGLQVGQNFGTMEASFYSDSIRGINIAAGASVFMGEHKTVEDKLLEILIAGDSKDRIDIAQAARGTCEWIFHSTPFRNWTRDDSLETGPLYIQGTPGSGKSVLLKFFIKEVEKRLRIGSPSLSSPVDEDPPAELGVPGKTIAVACFCDDRSEHRRSPIWILRTLLYRLIQKNRKLVKHVQKHIPNVEDLDAMGSDLDEFQSPDILQKILEELIPDPEVEVVYFVIDGLDQCGPYLPAVVRLVNELSTKMNSEARKQGQQFSLRCIISDRGSQIVRDKILPKNIIDMPTENKRDIDEVTDFRVKGIQEYRNFSESIRETLADLLKQKSNGMFMWLSLVLDDLGTWEGVWTETRVKEKLCSIPLDVATFYKSMLERQPRDSVKRLQMLLMWVYFACRPITLQELEVILILQDEKEYTGLKIPDEDIEALRRNLEGNWGALFAVRDNFVHLSHQSVKDFLGDVFSDEGVKNYPKYGINQADAHRQIASTCLTYLQLEEVQGREVPSPPVNGEGKIDESQLMAVRQAYLDGFPFLQYSVEFVGHHLRGSQIEEEADVKGMEEFFAVNSTALSSWVRAYDLLKRWTTGKYSGFSSSTSLLFVAARLNLPWLAQKSTTWVTYASLPTAICAPDSSGWSAIHIAADSEAVGMVSWLLKNGALVDVETLGLPHLGRTALHFAASKRSESGPQMVQELLKGGAKANVQTRQGGNTPLHYAIDGRSVKTVRALLDSGADVNLASRSGLTALHKAAAIPGLEEIVEVLLENGADPNKKTSVGAVSAARGLASLKASRSLWNTYYAVNTSHTALHIAAKVADTERTVEVLLKKEADPNSRDSSGRTPLHIAVVGIKPEPIIKLLIEHGADVNLRDTDGKSPLLVLLIAICLQAQHQPQLLNDDHASQERMIMMLLSAGADPLAEGNDKQSPLSYATQGKLQWASDLLVRSSNRGVAPKAGDASDQKGVEEEESQSEQKVSKKGILETQASRWLPKRTRW
ncbi:skeletrophin [Penicillium brasilianum]|uniref:Skeletrophin n=1 Tax=Penicillium brasilianum TaxID=104259 RepID=A0A1S9REL5_PENBI|nr:skeletrophin [Penicillium brasilianum]